MSTYKQQVSLKADVNATFFFDVVVAVVVWFYVITNEKERNDACNKIQVFNTALRIRPVRRQMRSSQTSQLP